MARRFPDTQKGLAALLIQAGFVPERHAGSATPPNLAEVLPFVRVIRIPAGGSDRVNDVAIVTIDVFAATYALGEPLAERIRQYLTESAPPPVGPVVFDRITNDVGPAELPWSTDPGVRRFGATYRVVSRRHLDS